MNKEMLKLLVAYDTKGEADKKNSNEVRDFLKASDKYLHLQESVWLIYINSFELESLWNFLNHMLPNSLLTVLDVTGKDFLYSNIYDDSGDEELLFSDF